VERTEMRMLRWILGLTLRDRKRNDDIRRILGVACITDKVREARLRWYGHVQRREDDDCVKRILEANVGGQRSRIRQRKRWIDVVKHNMEDLQLNVEDAENRAEWRRRTCVADPHLRDPQPEGERVTIKLNLTNFVNCLTYSFLLSFSFIDLTWFSMASFIYQSDICKYFCMIYVQYSLPSEFVGNSTYVVKYVVISSRERTK